MKVRADMPSLGEDSFRRVVEWAPTAMVLVAADGRIVLINAQAEQVFGYRREELQGQPVEVLVPRPLASGHPRERGHFFADPHPRPMGSGRDLYAKHRDGTEFPVEIGLNPIETADGILVLASIVDITERLRARQKLEDALREKTVLLNEVHHRVKNNLQLVSSLLNLQATHTANPQVRAILDESQSRVRAMALTHQLLYERKDYSRIDLGDYLDRLIQLLTGSHRDHPGVTVRKALPRQPVYLDFERAIPCGLVVNELVTNAYKHAFPGSRAGEILIGLRMAGGELELTVADDGIGLPAELELDDVTSLGLKLVPLLSEQLGGRLTVARAPGTRFALRFPESLTKRNSP